MGGKIRAEKGHRGRQGNEILRQSMEEDAQCLGNTPGSENDLALP
jgi:hypothetical protein